MKKLTLLFFVLAVGFVMSGCPVFSDDCGSNGYGCGNYGYGSNYYCQRPSDCASNETCSRAGRCVVGDCSWADIGCVQGYSCSSADGAWHCVTSGSISNGTGGEGGVSATAGAGG